MWNWCNLDQLKMSLLLKNPQFLTNLYDTCLEWIAHEQVTLLEYQLYWIGFVDFLLMPKFCASPTFFLHQFLLTVLLLHVFFSLACPKGTYKPSIEPGDKRSCFKCPYKDQISDLGSWDVSQCRCRDGYRFIQGK